jgi:ketosteroid isomerase-like protein
VLRSRRRSDQLAQRLEDRVEFQVVASKLRLGLPLELLEAPLDRGVRPGAIAFDQTASVWSILRLVSTDNVEIVRHMHEAWSNGDLDAARRAMHPNIEWHEPPEQPGGRSVYRGYAEVEESIRNWVGTWNEFRYELLELIDAGEKVLSVGRQTGRGKGSGVEVTSDLLHLWTLRDGRVVEMRMFMDRAEAFRAAGLQA